MDNLLSKGSFSPGLSSSSSSSFVGTPNTECSTLFSDVSDIPTLTHDDDEEYVLVVGGLGYIGSHTTLELLGAGYNVVIIDQLSNSFREVFDRVKTLASLQATAAGRKPPSSIFHEVDYRNKYAMESILKRYALPDSQRNTRSSAKSAARSRILGVIHFAAYKSVEESINNPLKYYANNVSGMIDFCSLLEQYGIQRFIFSSSATVYGSIADEGRPLQEELCSHAPEIWTDQDGTSRQTLAGCTGITNPYGRTKWMCEAILADVAISNPSWTIVALRYFNPVGCDSSGILGEDPRGIPSNLLPVVAKVVTGDLPILNVYGSDYDTPDGTTVRDFIHVTDLARGHIAALVAAINGRIRESFRTFNLGTGQGHTVMDVVNAMQTASTTKILTRSVGRRKGDVGFCVARAQRAEVELRWKTEKSIEDASRDLCTFLKATGRLSDGIAA